MGGVYPSEVDLYDSEFKQFLDKGVQKKDAAFICHATHSYL